MGDGEHADAGLGGRRLDAPGDGPQGVDVEARVDLVEDGELAVASTASCSVSLRFFSPPDRSTLSGRERNRRRTRSGRPPLHQARQPGRRARRPERRAQHVRQADARHLDRVLHGQEQPGLGPPPRGQGEQVDPSRVRAADTSYPGRPEHVRQRRLARPLGPITAWTSPLPTSRSIPAGSPSATLAPQPFETSRTGSAEHREHAVALDVYVVTGTAWWPAAAGAGGRPRTCCRASSTRACTPRMDLALGQGDVWRGCTDRRSRTWSPQRNDAIRAVRCRTAGRPASSTPPTRSPCRHHDRLRDPFGRDREAPRPGEQTRNRESAEDLAEEPGHHQSFGHLRGHAAALQLVPLLLVDGPDRRTWLHPTSFVSISRFGTDFGAGALKRSRSSQ